MKHWTLHRVFWKFLVHGLENEKIRDFFTFPASLKKIYIPYRQLLVRRILTAWCHLVYEILVPLTVFSTILFLQYVKRCIYIHSYCSRSSGPGSQCHPKLNVYLDLGNPRGAGFWVKGSTRTAERTKRVSLRATGSRVGRILTQQGGFQVSRQGEQGGIRGIRGTRGMKGTRGTRGKSCTYVELRLVYVTECLQWMNDTSYVHIIIIIGMNVVDNLNSV